MQVTGTVNEVLRQKGSALYSISPQATVFEAITRMSEKNVGALVVMDGPRLVGVFTERDYTRRIALEGRNSRDTKVRDILPGAFVTVTPKDDVGECMTLMTRHRVRHLPVLDADKVVGLVSIGDLVNHVITAQDHTIRQLENYLTGTYPA